MHLPVQGRVVLCLEKLSQSSWELLLYHTVTSGRKIHLSFSVNLPVIPLPHKHGGS